MDQTENQYKKFSFPHPSVVPQKGSKKAYAISTKPSSSAREKCENKISSHFQLNKKPVIFEAVRVYIYYVRSYVKHIFSKNEVLVIFSSTLWLTYEIKYFYENFEDNSK